MFGWGGKRIESDDPINSLGGRSKQKPNKLARDRKGLPKIVETESTLPGGYAQSDLVKKAEEPPFDDSKAGLDFWAFSRFKRK